MLSPKDKVLYVKNNETDTPTIEVGLDTKVLTDYGFKRAKDLVKGDNVYTKDGDFHKVLVCTKIYINNSCILKFANNTFLQTTTKTTLKLKSIRQHKEWEDIRLLPIRTIIELDMLKNSSGEANYRIEQFKGFFISGTEIPTKSDLDNSYVDGFLFGCLIKTLNDVRLTSKHIEGMKDSLNDNLHSRFGSGIRLKTITGLKNTYRCVGNLKDYLTKLEGLKNTDSYLYELLCKHYEDRLMFLEGVLDARGNNGVICSVDLSFLRVISIVASSLGFLVKHSNWNANKNNTPSITILNIESDDDSDIYLDGCNSTTMTNKLREINLEYNLTPVMLIQIEENRGVVTDNFILIGE